MRLHCLGDAKSRILEWISAGKTDAGTGIIMGFKTRRIDHHVTETLGEPGVAPPVQAAVRHAAAPSSGQLPRHDALALICQASPSRHSGRQQATARSTSTA